MNVAVFTGPTLSAEEVCQELDAICLPPVSQGDVYRIGLRQPRAIGIIDGYFHRVAAVWHKEILWAMSRGIHVFGSASMGALRAAELTSFGMVGVGPIFEAYASNAIEDDDEVAVAHGQADVNFRCLSEALVNIRSTLRRAQTEKIITAPTCATLERIAKDLFYPERSYPALLRQGAEQGLPKAELESLRDWLPRGQVNQKRLDAVAMLRHMRAHLASSAEPKQVDYHLHNTTFWNKVVRTAGVAEQGATWTVLSSDAVLDEVRLRGRDYLQLREQALLRDLALSEAEYRGMRVEAADLQQQMAEFRRLHGLQDAAEFDRWLQANHLTPDQFEELMRDEVLLSRVLWSRRHLLPRQRDHLRLKGQYRVLWERAHDKQLLLEQAGLSGASLEAAGVTEEQLLHWYFGRLGCSIPANVGQFAGTFGFEDTDAFLVAVLREFLYGSLTSSPKPFSL